MYRNVWVLWCYLYIRLFLLGSAGRDITVQKCSQELLQEQEAVLCHLWKKFQISTLTTAGEHMVVVLNFKTIPSKIYVPTFSGNPPPRNWEWCSETSLLRPWTECRHSTQWGAARHTHHWGRDCLNSLSLIHFCYTFSWPTLECPTSWLNLMKVVACSQE